MIQFHNPQANANKSHGYLFSNGLFLFLAVSVAGLTLPFGWSLIKEKIHVGNGSFKETDAKINFIPETERPLDVCVIGLDAHLSSYFFLPSIKKADSMDKGQWDEIQRQLYWLNLELSHSRILSSIPSSTQLYVAIPDSKSVTESLGGEKEFFIGYLKERCGWPEDRIRDKVHFFKSPTPLVWSQDIGKILGKDDEGRWVIFRGPNDLELYRQAILSLCAAYPGQFAYCDLPNGISAEGGDEDLVRTPDGKLVLLVGRHRAVRYLQWCNGYSWADSNAIPPFDQPLNTEQIAFAHDGLQKAFEPLQVVIIPEKVMENPALGTNELFHLDMVLAVAGKAGEETAFVPTYLPHPVDRINGHPLDPAFVKKLQWELDKVAEEMKSLGFSVKRLAFGDHPVRGPSNLLRFYDPVKGRCVVFLSKYPRQLDGPFSHTSEGELLSRLTLLRQAAESWMGAPDEPHYHEVQDAISGVWKQMDATAAEPNPYFVKMKRTIEKAGIDVVTVPDYPWGAGGIHCETLH